MSTKNEITSQQIAEAMRAFAGTIRQLPPEVEVRRTSVGFRPEQTVFEQIAGVDGVRVEMLPGEEEAPAQGTDA